MEDSTTQSTTWRLESSTQISLLQLHNFQSCCGGSISHIANMKYNCDEVTKIPQLLQNNFQINFTNMKKHLRLAESAQMDFLSTGDNNVSTLQFTLGLVSS